MHSNPSSRNLEKMTNLSYSILLVPTKISICPLTHLISSRMGYIAKKLAKRSNCDSCKSLLIANSMDLVENHYLNLLSHGGLIVPSAKLAEFLAIALRSWITHTTSFKHTVSGMCGQHILKFLIGFLSRSTFVVQNITIGD